MSEHLVQIYGDVNASEDGVRVGTTEEGSAPMFHAYPISYLIQVQKSCLHHIHTSCDLLFFSLNHIPFLCISVWDLCFFFSIFA